MEFHMKLLAADEFRGRNTPSIELKIVSKYIALKAEELGLLPLLPRHSTMVPIIMELVPGVTAF